MTIKYNRFALFPHTCSKCEKSFWLEPYKHFKMDEYKGIVCVMYVMNICKECSDKIENERMNDADKEVSVMSNYEKERISGALNYKDKNGKVRE